MDLTLRVEYLIEFCMRLIAVISIHTLHFKIKIDIHVRNLKNKNECKGKIKGRVIRWICLSCGGGV
jgi:hypothetical protein